MAKGLFDDIIKDIDNAVAKVDSGKSELRDGQDAAKIDYAVVSTGGGGYFVDPERCKEVGIDPEEAAEKYADLKFQDVANEIGK